MGAARDYDSWFDTGWGAYAFPVEARAIAGATLGADTSRVLDIGCGTGRFAHQLVTRGASVVGVDREPAMLAVARGRLHGPLVVGDALALPLRDDGADVTLAVTLLEFVSDPGAVVGELARVTRVGGRIVIGALDPRSPWGWARRDELSRPPWSDARFLSRRELGALAQPYGPARLRGVLHAPRAFRGVRVLGPVLEALGRAVPAWGAFQVLIIEKR